jgi:hypothetical protein
VSDEGLVSLEDDDGVGAAAEQATEQIAEATTEVQEPEQAAIEPAAEVDAVEVAGSKYVPLRAVQAAREKEKAATRAAQEATARADQLQQQYAQIAPFAEILRQNPDLLKPRQAEAPRSSEPAPDDPELVQLAQDLDLYDPATGKPDTKKAARLANVMERRADQRAQQAIEPLQQRALQAQVQQNYATALNVKLPDGRQVDKAVLDDLWVQAAREPGGLQTLSDAKSVAALTLMAMGATAFRTPQSVQAPPQAPLVTEPSGGVPRARPYLSRLEENIAKEKGIAPAKWAENLKGFTKGAPSALED